MAEISPGAASTYVGGSEGQNKYGPDPIED